MSRATTALALAMVATLALAGCGIESTGNQSDTPPAGAGETSASGGGGVDNFTVTTLDGKKFELADKRGEVVALYFMAGWCGSCIPEARAWSELYPAYRDERLEVLMVSVDPNDTPETIESFRRRGGIGELPWTIDKKGELSRSLDVRSLDSTLIIGREGRIVYRDAAPTPREKLESELKEVL